MGKGVDLHDPYDFADWEIGDIFDYTIYYKAVEKIVRANLKLAFKQFGKGEWQVAYGTKERAPLLWWPDDWETIPIRIQMTPETFQKTFREEAEFLDIGGPGDVEPILDELVKWEAAVKRSKRLFEKLLAAKEKEWKQLLAAKEKEAEQCSGTRINE